MDIYIYRNKERFGPYSREAVLEYVKHGIFTAADRACFAGMTEWKTVGDLVGIAAPQAAPAPAADAPAAASARPAGLAARRPARRRRAYAKPKSEGVKNLMIALNLALILIVVAAAYARWGTGSTALRMRQRFAGIMPALAPAPAAPDARTAAAWAASLSAVIKKAPVAIKAPAPPAASAPAPKPFDPADLIGNPQAWPRSVRLKQDSVFPVVFNSQVVGSAKVPAGSEVKLVSIQGDQLVVDYQGGTQKIFWKLTNLEEAAKAVSVIPKQQSQ